MVDDINTNAAARDPNAWNVPSFISNIDVLGISGAVTSC